jgi:putative NADH-flavin reductase
MNIGIVGATGNIGQRVVAEAVERGHQVTALRGMPRDSRRTEAPLFGKQSTSSTSKA